MDSCYLSPFFHVLSNNYDDMHSIDDKFFLQAIKQAIKAQGFSHPNPSVGAVITKDKNILGLGHTKPIGQDHAEIVAIKAAKDLKNATLYVTLEPCAHFGRTPPCIDAIINSGITRVVYGVNDPNPLVNHRGLAKLKACGIEIEPIVHPLLKQLSRSLIKPFYTFLTKNRPYIIAKIATSANNKISTYPYQKTSITNHKANMITHALRSVIDAIMIGTNTAQIDDPKLTARLVNNHRQPSRIVLDKCGRLTPDLNIFNHEEANTILIIDKNTHEKYWHRYQELNINTLIANTHNTGFDLDDVVTKLKHQGFLSLLIEPGAQLFSSLINHHDIIDEIWWFTSPQYFSAGLDLNIDQHDLLNKGYHQGFSHKYDSDNLNIFVKNI